MKTQPSRRHNTSQNFKVALYQNNKARLKHLFKDTLRDSISTKTFNELLTSLQKIAIVCSYIIFHSKYDNVWAEPEYVIF